MRQLFGRHARRNADHQFGGPQAGGRLHQGVEWIDRRHHQQFHALPLFFGERDHVREQLLLVAGEELIVTQLVFPGPGR